MNESLDPKEIARIKKLARSNRIRRIRRRAAVAGATLAAVFSGAILVRTQLEQSPASTGGTQTALVPNTGTGAGREPGDDEYGYEGDDDDGDEGVLSAVAGVAAGVVNGGSSANQADSTQAPAPPLTTSQS